MQTEESTYQRLVDGGYTEEQIKMILGLAGLEEDKGTLSTQFEMARALRNPQGPEGRQAGNVYVASNPLEHVGDVGNYYTGTRGVNAIYARQKALQDEQMKRRMEYLKMGGTKPSIEMSVPGAIS